VANFVLIAVCILAGFLLRKSGKLPQEPHKAINAWLIHLALPAVSFKYMPHIVWSSELLLPLLAPVLVFVAGFIYVKLYTRRMPTDQQTTGGLILMACLGNTGFIGFPLVTAYFGEQQISNAVICDQSTVLLFSTIGAVIAVKSSGAGGVVFSDILKRLVRFPPLIGCALALTVPRMVDLTALEPFFSAIAATTAPLALFSVGMQLKFDGERQSGSVVSSIVFYKLVIAPALALAAILLLHGKGPAAQVSVFQMGMPSLLSAAVIANECNLNPPLVNRIVGVGILVSLATTGIWFFIVKALL
jgi:malate permease and related proteins